MTDTLEALARRVEAIKAIDYHGYDSQVGNVSTLQIAVAELRDCLAAALRAHLAKEKEGG